MIYQSLRGKYYISLVIQDKLVEARVYEQMSLVSCAVGFAWSKWSNQVGEQQFVVKACECLTEQVSSLWCTYTHMDATSI